jgi:hypothetical protein
VEIPAEAWLDGRIRVRPSAIHGLGLFASDRMEAGELILVLGGDRLTDAEVRDLIARGERYDGIVLDENVNLRIRPADWPGIHGNHSCDPNLWLIGPVTMTLRRDVEAGDELVSDYATYTMTPEWSMPCACGSPCCRSVVTGDDWRRADLQERYAGHVADPIARRITEGPRPTRS